jgi:hypothetical protein
MKEIRWQMLANKFDISAPIAGTGFEWKVTKEKGLNLILMWIPSSSYNEAKNHYILN